MTKKLSAIALLAVIIGLVAAAVSAATISFTPVNVSVRQGQTFVLSIAVNPQGVKNYTSKVELQYPANLLEVRTFTFGNSWIVLSQPGYDLVDNTGGKLIKTAGYPGGLSSTAVFGTATFYAKQSGSGVIKAGSSSLVLDANNQNILVVATLQTAVNVLPAVSVPGATVQPVPGATVSPTVSPSPGAGEAVGPQAGQNLFAQIGGLISLGTGNAFVGILILIVILAAGFWVYRRRQKKGTGQL